MYSQHVSLVLLYHDDILVRTFVKAIMAFYRRSRSRSRSRSLAVSASAGLTTLAFVMVELILLLLLLLSVCLFRSRPLCVSLFCK